MNKQQIQLIMNIGLLAGKIMMESGAEMYRIQDTMERIVSECGLTEPEIYTTPTGIFLSAQNISYTKMIHVTNSAIDLYKITEVNSLSRQFANKEISMEELYDNLKQLHDSTLDFPFWLKIMGAFILSCTLMILFVGQYDWQDFIPAGCIGAIGYAIDYYIKNIIQIGFISSFVASAIIGLMAITLCNIGIASNINHLIIGSIMPLVPGVSLTNALRDLISGHIISGLSRMGTASLSAMAIGGGVAFILRFFG